MLEQLIVKNFAIIEDITVDFKSGMTVLTGETGAGKSLIIDTISLLLGSRADSDMIRYGEVKATITGVFTYTKSLEELFNRYSIPVGDKVIVHREIYDNSRNILKINNTNVTLTILKQVSSLLADIHVQNDTYKLFNPEGYLDFIDPSDDKKFDKLLANYSKSLYDYVNNLSTYDKISKGQKAAIEKLEFLKYEQEEITSLELYSGIDTELEEKIAKLSNFDKIFNSLNEAYNSLNGDYSSIDMLYDAAKSIQKIASYSEEYNEYAEKLLDSYYISSEIKDEISRQITSLDYDEDELNSYIEKLNDINKAKDKYKKNVDELIEYLKKISLDIDMATNYDEVLEESKKNVLLSYNILKENDIELSTYRKKLSKKLEDTIINECKDLDLDNTRFEISYDVISYDDPYDKSIFTEKGTDKPSFLISFNKGEPLKPLYKVASGGEMSRIMLAFKSYLSKTSKVSMMIFDEIDTGVSGSTAKKIANKMHYISESLQVLCITHLPQVAAIGDNHKKIYKIENNNRTYTQIDDLSNEKRIEEIAMMLSGDKLSLYALEHARELLKK